MSVVETIRGLRKMGLADDKDGAAATPPGPPPSPRRAQKISVATVVAGLGGLDGLRTILTKHWRSGHVEMYPQVWLEVYLPEDLVELLTNGLEEALCRGFLNDDDAVGMAVRRAELLIGENVTLPLTRNKDQVLQLIREKEEDEWKLITAMMGEPVPLEEGSSNIDLGTGEYYHWQ